MKLYMSESDIRTSYLQAKNKSVQLTILAQMNLTTRTEIARVLESLGVQVSHKKPRADRKLDKDRAEYLYSTGLCDSAIAKAMGVRQGTIYNWRTRNGWTANPNPNGKGKMA